MPRSRMRRTATIKAAASRGPSSTRGVNIYPQTRRRAIFTVTARRLFYFAFFHNFFHDDDFPRAVIHAQRHAYKLFSACAFSFSTFLHVAGGRAYAYIVDSVVRENRYGFSILVGCDSAHRYRFVSCGFVGPETPFLLRRNIRISHTCLCIVCFFCFNRILVKIDFVYS